MRGGVYPEHFPLTYKNGIDILKRNFRACRVNEWCALINVQIADKFAKKEIFFGAYEFFGDVGAYWFDQIVNSGYEFIDPLPSTIERDKYYKHCWIGHSGHSVWVDQGGGKKTYEREEIQRKIKEEFKIDISEI